MNEPHTRWPDSIVLGSLVADDKFTIARKAVEFGPKVQKKFSSGVFVLPTRSGKALRSAARMAAAKVRR
jgi:predicted RecA/RadA family phage recombinase